MQPKPKSASSGTKRRFSKAFIQASIDAAPKRAPYNPATDAYDPNDPKAVAAFWKHPIRSNSYAELKQKLAERRRRRGERGPQKAPTKIALSLRLSPDVVAHFRATGEGWQTRIDEVLQRYVARRR
jgi:uncharacterized protein (DUF4415 family)